LEERNAQASAATDRPVGQRRRLVLMVVLVGAALAFGARWLEHRRQERAAYPVEEGELALPGLRDEVWAVRDRNGVPHIRGEHPADAWLGLGFVQAQDRLGQLLWLRRSARGETAAWIGPAGLAADRWARTLDFARGAARDLERASPQAREVLGAYAAGVNAWLAQLRAGTADPPAGLPVAPEAIVPWSAEDSLAIAKLRAWQLADATDEMLAYEAVVRRVGPVAARAFFPVGAAPRAAGTRAATTPRRAPEVPRGASAPLRRAGGMAGRRVGSAAWVVSGRFTRRGAALLAGDLHAAPRVPGPVYEAHLRAGRFEVAGATLPGIPVFWAGFNGHIAWIATHTPALTMDLVEETLYREDPSRVLRGRRWRSLTERIERIPVEGEADDEWPVRTTAGRPMVDALLGADRPLSLRWTGQRVGGIDGFVALTRARDAAGIRGAMAAHGEPLVTLAWVDAAGEGGIRVAGAAPAREVGSGFQPVPADNPAYAWRGWLGTEALPAQRLGPARPWAIAAGRAPVAADGPLEPMVRPGPARARIEERLQAAADDGPIDVGVLVDMQRDTHANASRRIVSRALALAGALGHEEAEIAELLRAWDGDGGAESRGAAAYQVFVRRMSWAWLEAALGHPVAERLLGVPRAEPDRWLGDALAWAEQGGVPEMPWTAPEVIAPIVRESLEQAWLALSVDLGSNRDKWRWGRLHRLRFTPLWPGGWDASGGIGPFPVGGDGSSLAVADFSLSGASDVEVVSAYRFAADAGNLDQALTQLAPGQSGHPGHPHARDRLVGWLRGQPSLLSTSDPVIEDGPVARLHLVPAVPGGEAPR